MKKFTCLILALLLILSLVACQNPVIKNQNVDNGNGGEDEASVDQITILNTCDYSVNSLSAKNPSGFSQVDHSVSTISGNKANKYVGMFYFLWNGMNGREQVDIYDATKLMQEFGSDFWNGTSDKNEGMFGQYHYWGEPLFGYYSADDPYVLRKHIEMLTYAGIDFLAFDCSNESIYTASWTALLEIMQQFYDQGFNVPKVVFYTRTSGVNAAATSGNKIQSLYDGLYKSGDFYDLWFQPNGKPLIIGEKSQCSAIVQNFFDFRSPQWPNEPQKANGVPWMDFTYPQKINANGGAKGGSIMSVSVAQHPALAMSDSVLYSDIKNFGRGYNHLNGNNNATLINEGINFQQQWNYAIEQSPETVFVTGWNEWIAKRNYDNLHYGVKDATHADTRVYMVDACNEEYSRDIEPMKGGYGDYYYLQLVKNVRAYKGETSGSYSLGQFKTIDVKGSVTQWGGVTSSFRDFVGDTVKREHRNASNTAKITDDSARNDISEIRLCYDTENVYIMVSTEKAITEYTQNDKGWMNIYIGVEGSSLPSFEEFQYVINRSPNVANGTTSIEQSLGGYEFSLKGETATYTIDGKYMQIKIPRASLGLASSMQNLKIKVTDNVKTPSDIMDYYVSGDSAPIGRFAYNWRTV